MYRRAGPFICGHLPLAGRGDPVRQHLRPGDLNWSRLIPGPIRSGLNGSAPIIRSDGTPERDYIYLNDAVDGYRRVAAPLPGVAGEAFNLGTGRPISASALVGQILNAAGRPELQPRILGEA